MAKKFYVALCNGARKLVYFQSWDGPPKEQQRIEHDANAFIGPFKTRRGAEFMRDHGANNPHCQTVADAERISKKYSFLELTKKRNKEFARMQFLTDIMTTAVEGGSDCIGYWGAVHSVVRSHDLSVVKFNVVDDDDNKGTDHVVTPEKINEAIHKVMHGHVKVGRGYAAQFIGYPGDIDNCDYDATGTDIVIQVALFGEIRYS